MHCYLTVIILMRVAFDIVQIYILCSYVVYIFFSYYLLDWLAFTIFYISKWNSKHILVLVRYTL